MPNISFHIPAYPHRRRFSDPNGDFDGMEAELAAIASRPPASLSSMDHYLIFNSFLPAGSFEEMAPYLPHALRLVVDDNGLYSNEAPDAAQAELLESLITWCYVEQEELERHPQLRDAMQEAFLLLFTHWTADTRGARYSDGSLHLLNANLLTTFMEKGDWIAENSCNGERLYPWLRSAHYLPRLHALNSVPHAAWALYLSDSESCFPAAAFLLSATLRRRAVDIVEQWLLTDAALEDVALWDPIVTRHRELLYLFPS